MCVFAIERKVCVCVGESFEFFEVSSDVREFLLLLCVPLTHVLPCL